MGLEALRRNLINKSEVFIRFFAKANNTQLQSLVATAATAQFKAICEIVFNFTHGSLTLPKVLSRHNRFYRTISDSQLTLQFKKSLLSRSAVYRKALQRLIKACIPQIWGDTS